MMNFKSSFKKLIVIRRVYLMFLAFFHRNHIVGSKGNKILKKKSLLLNSNILFRGRNNEIMISSNARIDNYSFKIYGNNNKIIIGEGCLLNGGSFWIEDDNNFIIIGANTTIQPNTQLAAIEGCKILIGEDCMFSSDIVVCTGDSHSILNSSNKRINKSLDVNIGNHCWIGHRVLIMKGASISNNSIVGAGSIVNKQFKDENIVIAGIPSRVIKEKINWNRERL